MNRAMQYLVKNLFLNPMIYLCFGLGAIALGVAFFTEEPRLVRITGQVKRLEPLTARSSTHEVFLEGRISEQNSPAWRQLVVYLKERYSSSTARTSSWIEFARHTPPLLIDTPVGVVRIVNSDYELESTAVTVEESAPTLVQGAVQARGFVAGSPVFVVGTVLGEQQLYAQFVYSGTRDTFLVASETRLTIMRRGGAACLLAGLSFCFIGFLLLRGWLHDSKG